MIKWRPEGWECPIEIKPLGVSGKKNWHTIDKFSFEAGADAILDALRDQAKNNHLGSETRTGHWICISIPDEEG